MNYKLDCLPTHARKKDVKPVLSIFLEAMFMEIAVLINIFLKVIAA